MIGEKKTKMRIEEVRPGDVFVFKGGLRLVIATQFGRGTSDVASYTLGGAVLSTHTTLPPSPTGDEYGDLEWVQHAVAVVPNAHRAKGDA